jgi:sulfur carrier protein ThiS
MNEINHKKKGKRIMRILYINNQGGGFADYIQIEEGKTVEQFFKDKMPAETSTDYLIRVNRQPVPRDYVLKEGDRVTVTPTKIDGAR